MVTDETTKIFLDGNLAYFIYFLVVVISYPALGVEVRHFLSFLRRVALKDIIYPVTN
jgi:hypothetical protein